MGFLKKRSIIHYLDPCMYVSPCLTLSLTWRQERNQGTIIVTRDRSKRSITFLTRQWIAGKIIDISELPPTAQAQTPRRMSIRHGRRKIRLMFVCISPGLLSAIIALETTRIYLRALAKATWRSLLYSADLADFGDSVEFIVWREEYGEILCE